jgi:hypothetical protein
MSFENKKEKDALETGKTEDCFARCAVLSFTRLNEQRNEATIYFKEKIGISEAEKYLHALSEEG